MAVLLIIRITLVLLLPFSVLQEERSHSDAQASGAAGGLLLDHAYAQVVQQARVCVKQRGNAAAPLRVTHSVFWGLAFFVD